MAKEWLEPIGSTMKLARLTGATRAGVGVGGGAIIGLLKADGSVMMPVSWREGGPGRRGESLLLASSLLLRLLSSVSSSSGSCCEGESEVVCPCCCCRP